MNHVIDRGHRREEADPLLLDGLQEGESVVITTDRPGLKDGIRVKLSAEK